MTPARKTKPRWLRWDAQPLGNWTAEQAHSVTRELLSADPLSTLGLRHDGSPGRVDANGDTKAARSDLLGDVQSFDPIVERLNSPMGRLTRFVSTRTLLRKDGKVRPIDMPTEDKRLDQHLMLALTLIPLAVQKKAMDPRVVGFRSMNEFEEYVGRKVKVTIQDVFASTMFRLVRDHGPYVVLIDLINAFGNVPHKAIHTALKELLDLNHQDRRRVVESARIRTRLTDGRIYFPKGVGIEQGSPIAPFLFNLVQSLIARRLRAAGFESGCFGDDIGIAARTEGDAERAYEVYCQVLINLGFDLDQALRPLGTDPSGKGTVIYDARYQPVPMIKTYLISTKEIGLTSKKVGLLIKKAPTGVSIRQLKRVNQWKAVSTSFLRRVHWAWHPTASASLRAEGVKVKTEPHPSILIVHPGSHAPHGEDPEGDDDGDSCLQEASESRSTAMSTSGESSLSLGDEYSLDDEDSLGSEEMLMSLHSYSDSPLGESPMEPPLGAGKTAIHQPAGDRAGEPHDDRVPTPRCGPDAGDPVGENEADEDRHPSSALTTVFLPVRDEDILALSKGHRLRVGDHYRPHETRSVVIDLRSHEDQVAEWRLPWAARQLVRVSASAKGQSTVMVRPAGCWLTALRNLEADDGCAVRVQERSAGLLVVVWKRKLKPRPTRRPSPPPPAALVVERFRRASRDPRVWFVSLRRDGTSWQEQHRARSMNPSIGKVEVLASLVERHKPTSMAFRDTGHVRSLLGDGVRARQVDLARALACLQATRVTTGSPRWTMLTWA